MISNSKQSFGTLSKLLHWSMAVLLLSLFFIGLYMVDLDYGSPLYYTLPWWHKSIGLLVLGLLLFRYYWKLSNQPIEALKSHRNFEVVSARFVQNLFYILIVFICISGYFISTADGKGIDVFNWFEVPAIVNNISEARVDLIGRLHKFSSFFFITLVVLHTLASLKHHFIDKDNTLRRML